jgi:CBS-domain-containing membrane protein
MIAPLFRKLPIRTREVFSGDSGRGETKTVFCPHRHAAMTVEDCQACPFARSVESDAVICVRGPLPNSESFAPGHDPRVDIAAAAARTMLHEIVPTEVACVHADASLEMATSLVMDRGLLCVPVVDADDRLIGIVSKTDLLRGRTDDDETQSSPVLEPGFHVEEIATRTVSEIMTPCVHALPEDAPVAFGISLMAFESLHEVPIVGNDGRVLGVATALDILRWMAERMGYVLARGAVPPTSAVCLTTTEENEHGISRAAK